MQTNARNTGFGLYATWQKENFSLDGIFRGSKDKYNIAVPGAPAFSLTGNTVSGALQAALLVPSPTKWNLEWQFQGTAQRHNINSGADSIGRRYVVRSLDSLTGRFGALLFRTFKTNGVTSFIPHLRISAVVESMAHGRATVGTRAITDDLGGFYGQFELGLVARLNTHTDLTLNTSAYTGTKLTTYTANLGLRFTW